MKEIPDSTKDSSGNRKAASDPFRAERQEAYGQPAPKQNWTVAVDLDWRSDTSAQIAAQKSRLAKMTKENDSTFVIDYTTGGPAGKGTASAPTPAVVHQFVVHKGKVEAETIKPSLGMSNDLKNLLHQAGHYSSAKRLGLIIEADGAAGDGLSGTSGKTDLKDLHDAIASGLNNSGHTKVDFMHLDSCVMGNLTVLDRLKDVANHIDASENIEISMTTGNQISKPEATSDILQDISANPDIKPGQLADQVVQDSKRFGNVQTMAHFDESQLPQFERVLNDFAGQLQKVIANPGLAAIVHQDLAKNPTDTANTTDWQSFLAKLQKDLPNGSQYQALRSSIDSLQAAQRDLVRSNYNQQAGSGPGSSLAPGDLAVFAPDLPATSQMNSSMQMLALHKFVDALEGKDTGDSSASSISIGGSPTSAPKLDRQTVAGNVDAAFNEVAAFLPADDLKTLQSMRDRLDRSGTEADFQSMLQNMLTYVQANGPSSLQTELIHSVTAQSAATVDRNKISAAPAWNGILDYLQNQTRSLPDSSY